MTKENTALIPEIIINKLTNDEGTFTLTPLAPGFGNTLGNALRRTLFSSIEGYAITHIKIRPSVPHEFTSIEGVKEGLQDIILNLKKVRFKKKGKQNEEKVLVALKGMTLFKGRDITKAASSFEVVNGDFVICHMEKIANFEIELSIGKGSGYEPAEEHKPPKEMEGVFPIDAIYTPIKNVTFAIENTLVGKRTDYEKLILNVVTDGSLCPKEALKGVSEVLLSILTAVARNDMSEDNEQEREHKYTEDNKVRIQELLRTPLAELGLSARVINSLGAHGIEYLKDLVGKKVADLLLLPNFGKKCMQDLEEFLVKKNISWDVDIANYE